MCAVLWTAYLWIVMNFTSTLSVPLDIAMLSKLLASAMGPQPQLMQASNFNMMPIDTGIYSGIDFEPETGMAYIDIPLPYSSQLSPQYQFRPQRNLELPKFEVSPIKAVYLQPPSCQHAATQPAALPPPPPPPPLSLPAPLPPPDPLIVQIVLPSFNQTASKTTNTREKIARTMTETTLESTEATTTTSQHTTAKVTTTEKVLPILSSPKSAVYDLDPMESMTRYNNFNSIFSPNDKHTGEVNDNLKEIQDKNLKLMDMNQKLMKRISNIKNQIHNSPPTTLTPHIERKKKSKSRRNYSHEVIIVDGSGLDSDQSSTSSNEDSRSDSYISRSAHLDKVLGIRKLKEKLRTTLQRKYGKIFKKLKI